MPVRTFLEGWPVYRQLTGADPLGRGTAAQSKRSEHLQPRTKTADKVARSICPYCGVGCGLATVGGAVEAVHHRFVHLVAEGVEDRLPLLRVGERAGDPTACVQRVSRGEGFERRDQAVRC